MVELDGSIGEGGGQVLRSALTLSILTGTDLRITNIRFRRSKPGLRPQHLKAVNAAAKISRAEVSGDAIGSTEIEFYPHQVRSGRYKIDIGTAGSTSLVLQTVFLPLSKLRSASTIIISGGTHVPWAPCFHYLDLNWMPILGRMGFDAKLSLEQAGYYPNGTGRITATIHPAEEIKPLQLISRGELKQISGLSAVSNLDLDIAYRQRRQALRGLKQYAPYAKIDVINLPSRYKGTMLLILAEFEHSQCCFYSLGALGKPAERVADETCQQFMQFLSTDGSIDGYLADQLLLPLCLANDKSIVRTSNVTRHLLTNAQIIKEFLPTSINVAGEIGHPGTIHIQPTPETIL
jgi:RNA 3'-terminal phosphate cyclase (ATP)